MPFSMSMESSRSIIYIGKAYNLRKRINEQFKGNMKLSNYIKSYGRGKRQVMCCTLQSARQRDKKIEVLERNLIRHELTNGHELINIQGKKVYFHEITTRRGNRIAGDLFGRKIVANDVGDDFTRPKALRCL